MNISSLAQTVAIAAAAVRQLIDFSRIIVGGWRCRAPQAVDNALIAKHGTVLAAAHTALVDLSHAALQTVAARVKAGSTLVEYFLPACSGLSITCSTNPSESCLKAIASAEADRLCWTSATGLWSGVVSLFDQLAIGNILGREFAPTSLQIGVQTKVCQQSKLCTPILFSSLDRRFGCTRLDKEGVCIGNKEAP